MIWYEGLEKALSYEQIIKIIRYRKTEMIYYENRI